MTQWFPGHLLTNMEQEVQLWRAITIQKIRPRVSQFTVKCGIHKPWKCQICMNNTP